MKFESALVPLTGCLLLCLQGCGGGDNAGGGDDASPTQAPRATTSPGVTFTTPTSTRFTSPAPKSPRAPSSGTEVADLMNREYHGFKEDDETSSYGVFLRSTESTEIFCHQTCMSGWADCRVSGSIFNDKVMVTDNGTFSWSFGGSVTQATGYYVNGTEVLSHLAKCFYATDGGTDNKYNMGCGCFPEGESTLSCDDPAAPFWSLDPETDYTKPLTDKSPLVNGCSAKNSDAGTGFFQGPAFYRPTGFPKPNEMFKGLQWRVKNLGSQEQWDEMVLDGEAMLERLVEDPASVVPAIVYMPDASPDAKTKALKMAQEFSEQWNLPSHIPIIKVDLSVKVTDGKGLPFSFEEVSDEVLV